MTSVWEQAAQKTATQSNTAGPQQTGNGGGSVPVADREKEFRSLDPGANPFGVESTVGGGGGGMRGPAWPDLLDRLIVLKPVEKKTNQPVPNQPGQTQDFYSCELTVLDGGALTVVTPARAANGNYPATEEQVNEYELPMTFPDWWAYGRAITAKLDRLTLPLYLGVVKRCPTGAGYRKGETWEDSTRAFQAWEARARQNPSTAGPQPQTSWGLIDPTPEQQQLALTWWRERTAS